MRRVVAVVAVLVALVATAVALGAGGGSSDTRVDILFDNAGFLVKGQDLKIAGAKAGSVKDVRLTDDNKARIVTEVDPRFVPFKADSRCEIQSQSLIGEKFVQCDPGSADAPALKRDADGVQTVSLKQTSAPIDLDQVLAAFRAPTPTRAALLVSALGGGLVGRDQDLSATLRRANPALAETERLIDQVDAERDTVVSLVERSDRVIGALADDREDVAGFIRASRGATTVTARRRAELQQSLAGLPGFLTEARSAFDSLGGLARTARPVVDDLQKGAPAANALVAEVPRFTRDAVPTLRTLRPVAGTARRALNTAAPQLRRLDGFANAARPAMAELAALNESLRDKGAIDGVLQFVYYATAATARFDSVSHILPAYAQVVGACNMYATTTVPGCESLLNGGGREQQTRKRTRPEKTPTPTPTPRPATPVTTPQATAPPSDPTPAPTATPRLPTVPEVVDGVDDLAKEPAKPVGDLLDYLLGGGG